MNYFLTAALTFALAIFAVFSSVTAHDPFVPAILAMVFLVSGVVQLAEAMLRLEN